MNALSRQQEEARAVIMVACRMLSQMRAQPPAFAPGLYALGDDCYVLLEDASRLFCANFGDPWSGAAPGRWSARLPKLLFDHPEQCAEILAAIVQEDESSLSEVAAATA